jgi:hypothetical protein
MTHNDDQPLSLGQLFVKVAAGALLQFTCTAAAVLSFYHEST